MAVAWTRLVGSDPYRPLGPHTSTGNAIGMLHDDIPLCFLLIVPDATGPTWRPSEKVASDERLQLGTTFSGGLWARSHRRREAIWRTSICRTPTAKQRAIKVHGRSASAGCAPAPLRIMPLNIRAAAALCSERPCTGFTLDSGSRVHKIWEMWIFSSRPNF